MRISRNTTGIGVVSALSAFLAVTPAAAAQPEDLQTDQGPADVPAMPPAGSFPLDILDIFRGETMPEPFRSILAGADISLTVGAAFDEETDTRQITIEVVAENLVCEEIEAYIGENGWDFLENNPYRDRIELMLVQLLAEGSVVVGVNALPRDQLPEDLQDMLAQFPDVFGGYSFSCALGEPT